jgi:hypothetical protein
MGCLILDTIIYSVSNENYVWKFEGEVYFLDWLVGIDEGLAKG